MAVRSLLAKDWQVDVDTASNPLAPTWVQIKGLKSMTESINETEQDDSDMDSGGYGSDLVTQRKVVLALTSARKQVVGGSFTDDPGQAFVRAAGRLVGYPASIYIRYYRKDGAPDAYTGEVHVTGVGGGGGSVTDLESFSPSFKFHGQPTAITNPLNTLVIPSISFVKNLAGSGTGSLTSAPATFAAAGGQQGQIVGSSFATSAGVSRVTALTVAGVTVTIANYYVESANSIVFIAPAHTAAAGLPVVVTNETGASTTGATAVTYV